MSLSFILTNLYINIIVKNNIFCESTLLKKYWTNVNALTIFLGKYLKFTYVHFHK